MTRHRLVQRLGIEADCPGIVVVVGVDFGKVLPRPDFDCRQVVTAADWEGVVEEGVGLLGVVADEKPDVACVDKRQAYTLHLVAGERFAVPRYGDGIEGGGGVEVVVPDALPSAAVELLKRLGAEGLVEVTVVYPGGAGRDR